MPATAVAPTEVGIEVGDFFVSSWGYDQTNVDFYKVVGLTPKGVKVQRWSSTILPTEGLHDSVVPGEGPLTREVMVRDSDGRPVWDHQTGHYAVEVITAKVKTKRLQSWGGSTPSFTVSSYASARKWDGTPKYQTGWGLGH